MAAAGFYAIENTEIRFGRDGNWYADGQVVANRRIADLFSRHVQRRPEGGYMLRIADEQAAIIVEDTPYVVIAVALDGEGMPRLELNDHSREELDPRTLQIGAEDVLYCRVKSGTEIARFLRPAYYQLTQHCAVTADGRVVLRLPSGDYPLARRR
jgi:hypothetical protein